jgi:predicted nucleotidyltransferase
MRMLSWSPVPAEAIRSHDAGLSGDNRITMTRDQAIAEIVHRLVAYYGPERIYLFGSAARGEAGFNSDLDFCVVLPDEAPDTLLTSGEIYTILGGMGHSKDVIPWRTTDFDARAEHVHASLPATIVREGQLLYDARAVAA